KYVIERDIPNAGSLTEEQLRDVSLRSLAALEELGASIQWLHSFVTDDKVYCVYIAPDEGIIRAHAQKVGIPASRVSAVRRLLDPANYA
ncbi:MAG TPA: DUF4242 domain-containing protein, partial [Thermoanaerobaculia bacterium]